MAKTSIKAAVRDALRTEKAAAKEIGTRTIAESGLTVIGGSGTKTTNDSFTNFAQKLGIGADNPLSTSSYGFNPITRNHTLLEWIHRGSWLGGVAIDVVADDMTREGVDFVTELEPEEQEEIAGVVVQQNVWGAINETIKWARLYGGAICVMLIDGQDLRTPLRPESVGPDQFKGLLVLDRWMVDPSLEDLVTDYGPFLGTPKYYTVGANAPALRGKVVHYSRLALRLEGIKLPYQQRLTENLWGISVIERLYDRMIAYDSASTGAAQLIYKSYLRTLKIKGMREIASSGGPAMDGLIKYTELMRRYQGIEGVTLIDGEDEFDAQSHNAFGGIGDALMQFAQQLSGALQIPLTRLFGQSPAGLNATGDNDMRNYYDHISQQQEAKLLVGVTNVYKFIAQSLSIKVPDNFALMFKSLWQLSEDEKAKIAKDTTDAILSVAEAGHISDQVVLQELRQQSRITGVFSNITAELIEAADDQPPAPEMITDPADGLPMAPPSHEERPFDPTGAQQKAKAEQDALKAKQAGSQGSSGSVGSGKAGGKTVRKAVGKRS